MIALCSLEVKNPFFIFPFKKGIRQPIRMGTVAHLAVRMQRVLNVYGLLELSVGLNIEALISSVTFLNLLGSCAYRG